ncbi:hypothetical protein [Halorussus lipolyticus]|uniref:hypothetical protein n=1 Tax=Halorussus lipolyticus TaxID=3034024 RepID=UPI0023E8B155|nr:hypothetical protein [Halorussus sp. DT80]
MGRWGKLAGQLHDGDNERPPSIEEFLESNHQLFTVIGIFGALSVYLMKFQRSSGEAGTGAVGAILLLFLLTSSVAVRNSYRCTERARKHGEYLLVFGYAVFMYSFVTLVVSVVLVIVGEYATGAESVLGSSFVYALVFVYVPFIFRADIFTEFEGPGIAAGGVRHAPHLGLVGLAGWHAMQWPEGVFQTLELGNTAYSIGFVLGVVGNHFVITACVFGVLWVVDMCVRRVTAA